MGIKLAALLCAGLLPNAEASVATMGIAFNTHALFYMLADGISAAVSTRVSNSLGANQPDTAKLSTTVITLLERVTCSDASLIFDKLVLGAVLMCGYDQKQFECIRVFDKILKGVSSSSTHN